MSCSYQRLHFYQKTHKININKDLIVRLEQIEELIFAEFFGMCSLACCDKIRSNCFISLLFIGVTHLIRVVSRLVDA
jgi:Na+-transporting NADH:ubiquinone oxidoreductase subunit NqrE